MATYFVAYSSILLPILFPIDKEKYVLRNNTCSNPNFNHLACLTQLYFVNGQIALSLCVYLQSTNFNVNYKCSFESIIAEVDFRQAMKANFYYI